MTAVAPTRASRRMLVIAGRGVLWLALAVMIAAVAAFVLAPRLVGGAALTVRTGSMAPALPVGSIVVVRHADPASLRVGDIATYAEAGTGDLVTHRIVGIDANHARFTFRGDANPVADPQQVPAAAIRGKAWFDVPYIGSVRNGIGDSRGLLVVLGVLCLGGYSVWQFAIAWRERKGRS